jgi:hypothetical protein
LKLPLSGASDQTKKREPNLTLTTEFSLFSTCNPNAKLTESKQPCSVELLLDPKTQLVTVDKPSPTISMLWDRAAQKAVINYSMWATSSIR